MNKINCQFLKAAVLVALIAANRPASGALVYDYSGSAVSITDNDATGVAFNFSVSDALPQIESIEVTLHLSSGRNGDIYAYLSHDAGGFVVLLNRSGVGTTTGGSSALGYADTGFNLTFSALGAANVHFYQNQNPSFNGNGELTGTWKPDARAIDPESPAGDFEAAGTADFSTFTGVNPNGNWTLFLADVSPGGISMVEDFSVSLTAVPEPVSASLKIFGGLFGGVALWRCRRVLRHSARARPPG